MRSSRIPVAIIGAGPYALSLASHLRHRGTGVRVFGDPMRFWLDMPRGRAVKSFAFATSLSTPRPGFRFEDYAHEHGIELVEPIDMQIFASYGLWVQRQLVPDIERSFVTNVVGADGGFRLDLDTGETVEAAQVVVATGLTKLARTPPELAIASARVHHTADIGDYAPFAGSDVTVIGGGQSALEAAGLAQREGARTRILVRGTGVWFSDRFPEHRSLRERLGNPLAPLGPGHLNWVLSKAPGLFPRLSEERRVRMVGRHNPPFGTWWVRDQLGDCPVHPNTKVTHADERADGLVLQVDGPDGPYEIRTDHVITGTGFEPDVDRLDFLAPELRATIARTAAAPRLSLRYESSVPGLYFVGPIAAFSFGPTLRFVCGVDHAAPLLARELAKAVPRRAVVLRPDRAEPQTA